MTTKFQIVKTIYGQKPAVIADFADLESAKNYMQNEWQAIEDEGVELGNFDTHADDWGWLRYDNYFLEIQKA